MASGVDGGTDDGELVLELELVEPVPPGVVVEPALDGEPASDFGGSGVVDGVGAGVGAVGAGAGGATVFSSFLQAVRPIAKMAAMRSERFISSFPFWRTSRIF